MKQPIKLYLAILNKGWIRREQVRTILDMQATKGVQLYLEELSKTFANPICSNRAKIVKRFLKTDCDFLMMLDNDVIPLHNPAELVFADKDVIGSPAKVRQSGRTINWVVYVKHTTEEGYIPVDFEAVDDGIDLLSVDIVGTGCILIRRNVLKKLRAPFLIEFNEDGECTYGTDFAFCRKAKKAGFKIYTTPQRVCEHVKELGLLDIQGYDDSDGRDAMAGKYGIPWGEYAISQKDWYFIQDILRKGDIKTILEFGSGLSSLLMSEDHYVISYETDKKIVKNIESKINGNYLTIRNWDGQYLQGHLGKYDLAFIDGPLGLSSGGMGRKHSIRIASEHADKIIVHDAGRQDEVKWQNKYLRGKFKLKSRSGWHHNRCHYWEIREKNNANT